MTQLYVYSNPTEKGTLFVLIVFTDEDGIRHDPRNLKWQLMRENGDIVNNRSFALNSFTSTNGYAEVILTGDDLSIFERDNGKRVFSIQGIYDSTNGLNLSITDETTFSIRKLLGQTNV